MQPCNAKNIRAVCAGLALLTSAWLIPANAMASDTDTSIRKEFPNLYAKVSPGMRDFTRVETLDMMLKESLLLSREFYGEHGRYPSTVAELTRNIDGADRFEWEIHGGGGKVFPTFRVEHRKDNRIVGSATEGMIYISDKARLLQKESSCHVSTYMRDFLRDADARTGAHFMKVVGVPASMSREEILAGMNESVAHNCR